MLATTVSTAPSYPHVGADAMWQGYPVTIHQRIGDDQALILGEGIQRRVDVAELAPIAPVTAFDRWRAARLDPHPSPFAVSRASDLYVDLIVWLADAGEADDVTASPDTFRTAMANAGYRHHTIYQDGLTPGRRPLTVSGWRTALYGEDVA